MLPIAHAKWNEIKPDHGLESTGKKTAGAGRTTCSTLFTFLMIAGRDLQISLQLTDTRCNFWPYTKTFSSPSTGICFDFDSFALCCQSWAVWQEMLLLQKDLFSSPTEEHSTLEHTKYPEIKFWIMTALFGVRSHSCTTGNHREYLKQWCS